jgi:hypothetical protein
MTPTPRRRHFHTQWQHVKQWSKDTHQEAEINRNIDAIMEQSLKDAGYRAEHVSNTKNTDRTYWKEAHVRSIPFFLITLLLRILISFLFLQIYRGRNDSEKYHILYRCPLAYLCGCRKQFKVCFTRDNVELKCAGTHDGTSHVEDKSKYLTNAQKGFLKRSTKSAPNESYETGRAHVRNSCNFSPDKRTPQDPTSIRCAQRVVVKQRRAIALTNTQGVKLDDTNGALTRLCNKLDFIELITRHNDPADTYHLDLHSVICLGVQWKGGNTFMESSKVDLLLNV